MSNHHEQLREQLANEWRASGAGVGRLPHLIPLVNTTTVYPDSALEIFTWGTRAAAGIARDVDLNTISIKLPKDDIFVHNRTRIWVCKPPALGSGDAIGHANKNLCVIVPPRALPVGGDTPLYVLEFGCPHPTWTTTTISAMCQRYTCDAGCGYAYDVDHGD